MMFDYYTALKRALFCGHASNAHYDLWQKNSEVNVRGMKLLKPGARCCNVASELTKMYAE